ncbi:MAG TPA: nucleoside hydrolase [Deltaproteobacteria bacterium]|nr:nucleoside hydrolase [Deltaproteobacteria bacterium]
MLDVVWDMETHDPDDFLTLLLLLGHPGVRLRAVTVTPGTPQQIGHVRRALSWFNADIPVGAHNLSHPGECVSSWHVRAYGPVPPSWEAEPGDEVLLRCCDEDTTLITGGPLKNLGRALQHEGFRLGRLVAQGGFAGEGVVPPEHQLDKFRGMITCPTYNLNGDPRSTLAALADDRIGERMFVSKNVCHKVVYDEALHHQVAERRHRSPSLERIWHGMEIYLRKQRDKIPTQLPVNEAIEAHTVVLIDAHGANLGPIGRAEALAQAQQAGLDLCVVRDYDDPPVCKIMRAPTPSEATPYGKRLHDPLAACCAIDPGVGTWAEVRLFRRKGKWGSELASGTHTRIIIAYDHQRFVEVFTASGAPATGPGSPEIRPGSDDSDP